MTALPNILIIGSSGSGKTTSLHKLPPEEVDLINVERKVLPFRHAASFQHQIQPESWPGIKDAIKQIKESPRKIAIVDSFTSIDEILLAHCRTLYKGFDIYSNHNRMVRELINSLKIPGKQVILIGIDEIVGIETASGGKTSRRALKVEGRELQGTIEKEFTVVFFTDVKQHEKTGIMEYRFCVNTDGVNAAKSPMDMFSTQFIPNDLAAANLRIKEYYNGSL